jgi:hypothetical protein
MKEYSIDLASRRPYSISPVDESQLATPRGWVCPVCNRVLAPSQPFCMFCLANNNKQPICPVDYPPPIE